MTRVHAPFARRAPLALAAALVLLALASVPRWGPRVLSRLSYFRVRQVAVEGTRYLAPAEVLTRLAVDTTGSVWDDLGRLERRVAAHPQVRAVSIERRLPGTLVVRVTENLPVAFVPSSRGLRAVDVAGRVLPIDPSRSGVDLPVLARPDVQLLRLLAELRGRAPALFERISNARRTGRGEMELAMPPLLVRTSADVSAERLTDIIPVERDLARRHVNAAELDLRFRDQVIARVQ